MNHMKKMMPAVWGTVMAIAMTACGSSAGEPAQSSVTQADREELTAVWKAASEKTGGSYLCGSVYLHGPLCEVREGEL